jgi:hypothetical protein
MGGNQNGVERMNIPLAQMNPARTDAVQLYPSADFPRVTGARPIRLWICNTTGSAATYTVYIDILANKDRGVSAADADSMILNAVSLAANGSVLIEGGLSIGPDGGIFIKSGTASAICYTLEGES